MRKPGKRSGKTLKFVMLDWKLLNSNAFKALPHSAGKALPLFLGKVKLPPDHPEKYSATFSYTYSEAQKDGFANTTHFNNIRELIAKGFIDPVDKGGLRGCGRANNVFRLSERWEKYGQPDFKHLDWRTFKPRMKQKSTPKLEMYTSRIGKQKSQENQIISKNGVVGAYLP
jgi:hypothetical protein